MDTRAPFAVRDASEADGRRLRPLLRGSTTAAGVRWSIEPAADPFAALRAETGGWTVALAEDEQGEVLGVVSVALRTVISPEGAVPSCYVTNLKVLDAHRGRGIGDALCWHAVELSRRAGGGAVPILMAIRVGNTKMGRRFHGPRGLPMLSKFASVKVHSVPVRHAAAIAPDPNLRVSEATRADFGQMADLAATVAAGWQFAPASDEASLERRLDATPGLTLADHLVAREGERIVGWLCWWDERAVREVRITGYTWRGKARHAIQDAGARLLRAPRPARVGDRVGCLRSLQRCVPADRPDVLRALLAESARRRMQDCSWLKLALDPRDPLAAALHGLPTHRVAFDARLTTPTGGSDLSLTDPRPLHLEAALI